METFTIQETYQGTIQGEGYWQGCLVDFIRLYGCPVGCSWCDQEYGDSNIKLSKENLTLDKLIAELKSPRVVITGGEPFIHKNLPILVKEILNNGKEVSIETSGAFWLELSSKAWITLSPKEHINSKYPVQKSFWERCNEIKLIIETGKEVDYYLQYIDWHKPVYFQPEWFTLLTHKKKQQDLLINLLQKYPNAKISLQMHKYLEIY